MSSPFYVTGGTLRHDAPSYVERRADKDLLEGLRKGEFCYVLTSRQMGKSSLMVRTARRLREQGIAVVVLDLTAIGQNITPDQWYDGLTGRMGRQLDLEAELETHWKTHPGIGPCQRFFDSIQDVVLPAIGKSKPLVLFVDEIDTVRSLPFSTDEFFAAIRECYNRRTEDPEFSRVTFCLLGVAMPTDLIRDTRLTPFNIGRRIELTDFTAEEAAVLARGMEVATPQTPDNSQQTAQSRIRAQQLLERALYWTNGHPYLTQRLCGAVLEQQGEGSDEPQRFIDDLCDNLFFSARARERDDNLIFVREYFLREEVDRAGLFHWYEKILRGSRVPDDETNPLVSALRLTGIVRITPRGLVGRNRIYTRVFDRRWVQANMPGAELRRQRTAFRRGVVRATAIAAIVVAAMIVMVLIATNEAAKARSALAQSYLSQAAAGRVSGVSGQRYDSLEALAEARRNKADEVVLRDEVIACLALADLKEKTNASHSIKPTSVSELNLDGEVSATGEPKGSIIVRRLKDQKILTTLRGFDRPVRQLRFSPKAPFLVAAYGGGLDNPTIVWNWEKGEKLFDLPYGIHANAIDFDAECHKLALGQTNGQVTIYALPGGQPLKTNDLKLESGMPRVPQVLRFSPSGNWLAESCLDDLNVQVWDVNTGRPVLRFFHPGSVFDLSWHPGGELLATACGDATVYLWETNRDDRPLKKLIGHENDVTAVAFNHRGTLLASAGVDETVRLWIPATDREVTRRLEGEMFGRLQFSSKDDALIASGALDPSTVSGEGRELRELPLSRARIWEISRDEYIALQMRTGPADNLKSIDFSPNGRWLVGASGERAMIWDAATGREASLLKLVHAHAVFFSADSAHLVASTDAGLFQYPLSEVKSGNQLRLQAGSGGRLNQVPDELDTMALSLDRTNAVVVRQDHVLAEPLARDGKSAGRTTPIAVEKHYHWLALHPQGLWLTAMMVGSNSIDILNLHDSSEAHERSPIPGSQYFVFSPDGKWLVTCWENQFQFYQVGEWKNPAFSIPRVPPSNQHAPIAFSRDGAVIALASSRYTIHLLALTKDDRAPTKVIGSLESPDRSPLEMLAFSADGRRLAAGTANLTVQLWNLALLREGLAKLDLARDWPAIGHKSVREIGIDSKD